MPVVLGTSSYPYGNIAGLGAASRLIRPLGSSRSVTRWAAMTRIAEEIRFHMTKRPRDTLNRQEHAKLRTWQTDASFISDCLLLMPRRKPSSVCAPC